MIGAVLVPLLGCALCSAAEAQGLPDEPIEFLETLEIADTLADKEERVLSIPKPDTTTSVPLNDLIVTTMFKNPIVSQAKREVARDSIADRKGLWQSVPLMAARVERRFSLAAIEMTVATPFNSQPINAISKNSVVSQDRPEPKPPRDSIADRKALRKTVRLIKSERPLYPQVARRQGWEGTVVLRINIDPGGNVEDIATQKSTGYDALDESAAQSVKTWRFDPAKDGEFPVSSVVDLPIRFNLDEYGIQASRPEPEPEPEPVLEKKPARLVKSERPDYPQTARQQGWEGTVMLRITVGTGGDVENVKIQESSGFPELDESAAQSVKAWQFDPAKLGDDPISSAVDLPVTFDIEESQEETGSAQ
jgi:TonB family protein